MGVGYFTPQLVETLFSDVQERTYGAGQIVVYDGDHPNHVFYVKKGVYKFYDTDNAGNEKVMYIGGQGSFFPIFYAFERKPHVDGFYATVTSCNLLLIPIDEFREKLKTEPSLAYEMLNWHAQEVEQIIVHLKSIEQSVAKDRVARVLHSLCSHHAKQELSRSGWYMLSFPISQQMLADLTGLTRETVNIVLKELDAQHAVRMPKRLTLELNKTALERVFNQV